MKYADVTGYWGDVIVSYGDFSPFSAHNIFPTLKHGASSLPKRGDLYRNWSFELITRSSVKCLYLHLKQELEKRLEFN